VEVPVEKSDYLAGQSHAAGHEDSAGGVVGGHHAELALLDEGD
jgi:hypothetical protein